MLIGLMTKCSKDGKSARNVLGGLYQPGKALSIPMSEEITNLYNQGYHTKEIFRDLKITEHTVRNILDHFRCYGIVNPLAVAGSLTLNNWMFSG